MCAWLATLTALGAAKAWRITNSGVIEITYFARPVL